MSYYSIENSINKIKINTYKNNERERERKTNNGMREDVALFLWYRVHDTY